MQDRHIGDVRVTRIEEQMGPGFPAKDFFPEFDADTFAAEGHWLAPSYYQPESGRLIASIHSWLLRTGKHTILVDACSGNHKPRPGMPRFDMLNSKYLDRLREAGVEPEEIDYVMCTHLHVDHVGWNTQAGERQVGADLPQRQVRDVAHRSRSSGRRRPRRRRPRPSWSTPTTIRCCPSSRPRRPSSCRASTPCAAASRSKPAPGHTPGQIRVDLEFARQARDLRRRRAAQSGAGAAVEMEQLLLRGSRSRAQEPPHPAGRLRRAGRAPDAGALRAAACGLRQGQGRPLRARLGLGQRARPLGDGASTGRSPALAI